MLRKLMLLLILLVIVSACGSAQASDADLELRDLEPTPDQTQAPAKTDTPASAESELSAEDIAAKLRPAVLKELGLAADTALELISYEAVNWPDASLGCPQPDMVYAQVITPGWKVTFRHAGEDIVVHAPGNFGKVVMCEDDTALAPGLEVVEGREPPANLAASSDHPAVQLALAELTGKSGLSALEIGLVEVSAEEWPSSCLGCAGADEMCLTVITPGYRVVLSYGDETYEFHTGRNDAIRLCEVSKN